MIELSNEKVQQCTQRLIDLILDAEARERHIDYLCHIKKGKQNELHAAMSLLGSVQLCAHAELDFFLTVCRLF